MDWTELSEAHMGWTAERQTDELQFIYIYIKEHGTPLSPQ